MSQLVSPKVYLAYAIRGQKMQWEIWQLLVTTGPQINSYSDTNFFRFIRNKTTTYILLSEWTYKFMAEYQAS
mgnify:FL=1